MLLTRPPTDQTASAEQRSANCWSTAFSGDVFADGPFARLADELMGKATKDQLAVRGIFGKRRHWFCGAITMTHLPCQNATKPTSKKNQAMIADRSPRRKTPRDMRCILIDYESIQPDDLARIGTEETVVLFVGAQQHRLPFDFVCALQAIGDCGRYIKIRGNGRNALDFHIAFYLGELLQQEPMSSFRIVSRDSGFNPLVAHLRERGFDVARIEALGEESLRVGLTLRGESHGFPPA